MKSSTQKTLASNSRIDPFNIIPFFMVIGFFIVLASTIFFGYVLYWDEFPPNIKPTSIMDYAKLVFAYSLPLFHLWITYRAARFVLGFFKEMRKIALHPKGLRIYRPYGKSIELSKAEVKQKICELQYAPFEPEEQKKRNYDFNIALVFTDGKNLHMTCSATHMDNLLEGLASYGVPIVEVEPSSLKLFV
ncbi:hypothetical protein ACFOSD_04300 [Salinispirillum marinum]|uniref:DUF2726 domain-containing protein n=2 Tax=Saccharospirillaceae TaxID=255527 RepID=A0ABV8BE30_9GAMM